MKNIGTSHLFTAGNMTKHLAWHEQMKKLSNAVTSHCLTNHICLNLLMTLVVFF